MKDEEKTKEQLLAELAKMRRCLEDLEASEAQRRQAEEEVGLLQTLIIAINNAGDLNEALAAALQRICHLTGWVYGEAWLPSSDGSVLERSPVWCSSVNGLEKFHHYSKVFTFPPGKGLPGRVWVSKKPLWIKDVTQDANYLRISLAREAGLKTGLAVPIVAENEVLSVIVFYMNESRAEDESFVRLVSAVGAQLGSVIRSKLAAESLRRSEEYFRLLIENSSDVITIVNLDGTIRYKSPSVERVLGYKPEDLVGKNLFDFVHAEDLLGVVEKFKKAIEKAGTVRSAEYRYRHKDGSWRILESIGKKLNNGSVDGIVVNSRDITERKRTEEDLLSLKKAVETMQIGVSITNTEGKIIYINPAEARMHGYTVEELIGKDVRAFAPPEKWSPMTLEKMKTATSLERESVNIKKDGSKFPVQLFSDVVRSSSGEIIGMVTTCGDMTKSKRQEEELMKVARLESLGMLAGGIAHDFNNILTIILGKISLAKMYLSPESKAFEVLDSAEKGCKRARDLTNQLLTFSKGGAPVRKKSSITELIKESTEFALRGSSVTYDLSIADDLWAVEIDEGQISQVINNLIMNANQAMPNGGVIKVVAENVAHGLERDLALDKDYYIKISIADQGVGIPTEDLSKIFDPYFTTKQKGSGLGLSTSYFIIKKHDGYIRVESQTGVGTTFYIYLPAFPNGKVVKEKISDKPVAGKGRVLVIDDEEDIRDTTVMMLKHIGYNAASAEDGAEGIEIYKKSKESGEPFDAVLVDLTIPGGMGGKEAILRLKEFDPDVKAIVTSGYSHDTVIANFKEHGFRAVVSKPYGITELSDALNKVISGK